MDILCYIVYRAIQACRYNHRIEDHIEPHLSMDIRSHNLHPIFQVDMILNTKFLRILVRIHIDQEQHIDHDNIFESKLVCNLSHLYF